MGRNSRTGQGTGNANRGNALPPAIVREIRYPEPSEASFTPTRFTPASTKLWFTVHMLRFCTSDFPEHHFTQRFYAQLMHCFGMIAHYNRIGFWEEFFTSMAGKVEFLAEVTAWPGYGSPNVTWCDVEREVIRRLRAADLLGFYRTRLAVERDLAERAEFARLQAKYAGGASPVDPGMLRAVLMSPPPDPAARWPRGRDTGSQLTLGLG